MRYAKRPKYKLDKSKIQISKDKKVTAEEIYKEMLKDKMKRRKRHG